MNWASRNEHAILAGVQIANWAPTFMNAAYNTYNAGRYTWSGIKRLSNRSFDANKRQRTDQPRLLMEGEDTQPIPDPAEPPTAIEDMDIDDQVIPAQPDDDSWVQDMIIAVDIDRRKRRPGGGGPVNVGVAKRDSRRRLSRIVSARKI